MSQYSSSSLSEDPNSSWNKILNLVPPGSKVLDIGCSSGNFGDALIRQKKCIVDGIELDKSDALKAKKKLRNVYILNIETDSLDSVAGGYDYIYFGDVIEHLVNPSVALKRLEPLFKNKETAKVLFSLPNMSHISVRLMLLNGTFEYGKTGLLDETHLHFYTLDELNKVFNRAGMEISHFDPVIKDYPKEVLDKELSSIGLSNTLQFTNFVNTTNASIFQLVGFATYSDKPKKVVLEKVSPRDAFTEMYNATIKHYTTIIENLKTQIKQLEAINKNLGNQNTELNSVINSFYESFSWQITKPIRILGKQVKRLKNR